MRQPDVQARLSVRWTRACSVVATVIAAGVLSAGTATASAPATGTYTVNNTSPACSDTGPGTPAQQLPPA